MGNLTKDDLFDRIGVNPFVEDFFVEVNRTTDMGKLVLVGGDWVPVESDMERASVTKIYKTSVNRVMINKLSAPAKELFWWLVFKVEYGEDWVKVNRAHYMEEHGIGSVNTYKTAVKDLVSGGVVAFTVVKDVFWINPKIFFSGSRVKKYPGKVRVYKPNKEK